MIFVSLPFVHLTGNIFLKCSYFNSNFVINFLTYFHEIAFMIVYSSLFQVGYMVCDLL